MFVLHHSQQWHQLCCHTALRSHSDCLTSQRNAKLKAEQKVTRARSLPILSSTCVFLVICQIDGCIELEKHSSRFSPTQNVWIHKQLDTIAVWQMLTLCISDRPTLVVSFLSYQPSWHSANTSKRLSCKPFSRSVRDGKAIPGPLRTDTIVWEWNPTEQTNAGLPTLHRQKEIRTNCHKAQWNSV